MATQWCLFFRELPLSNSFGRVSSESIATSWDKVWYGPVLLNGSGRACHGRKRGTAINGRRPVRWEQVRSWRPALLGIGGVSD
jgi:hypothetical protein